MNYPDHHAETLFSKGVFLARLGEWHAAAEAYREAIRLHPQDPRAHLNLGFVYYEMGCDDDAQKEFGVARELGVVVNPALEERS